MLTVYIIIITIIIAGDELARIQVLPVEQFSVAAVLAEAVRAKRTESTWHRAKFVTAVGRLGWQQGIVH